MELEEMKSLWEEMSDKLESNQILTDKLIIDMTQRKYDDKAKGLWLQEVGGSVVCFLMIALLVWQFDKFDTWYLKAAGIIVSIVMLVIPILSLRSIKRLRSLNVGEQSYADTILRFQRNKAKGMVVTKLSLVSAPFVFVFSTMLSVKLTGGKDIIKHMEIFSKWPVMVAIVVAVLFMVLFIRWIYNRNMKVVDSMEGLLEDTNRQ